MMVAFSSPAGLRLNNVVVDDGDGGGGGQSFLPSTTENLEQFNQPLFISQRLDWLVFDSLQGGEISRHGQKGFKVYQLNFKF